MQAIPEKIIKYICCVLFLTFLVLAIPSKASALTVGSLYSDLNGTNSNVNNMVLWADRYESFNNSKYIAFRDTANSYYLVWGIMMRLMSALMMLLVRIAHTCVTIVNQAVRIGTIYLSKAIRYL